MLELPSIATVNLVIVRKTTMSASFRPFTFDNTYARELPEFCVRWQAETASAPKPLRLNRELVRELGGDPQLLESSDGIAMLAGNLVPDGAEPVAQA